MSYIGRVRPTETTSQVTRDPFTGDGITSAFILSRAPTNEQSIIVTIGGVVQHDAAYTVSGTTLTFIDPPASGVEIEARIISDVGVGYLPPENSLEARHLIPNSITRSRMARFNLGNSPRQTVLSSGVDSNGYANFITVGAGLACNLSATTTPVVLSFANGFDLLGAVDYPGIINVDVNAYWSNLSPSNTNFLFVDRNSTTEILSSYTSIVPPQYEYAFKKFKQEILTFTGTNGSTTIPSTYDWTWTPAGSAQIQNNALSLNGSTDWIENLQITSLGVDGWTVECDVNHVALPTSGNSMIWFSVGNASGYGMMLGLTNTAGVYKAALWLSSNGTSFDLNNGTLGTKTTYTTGIKYHVAITFNSVTGNYYVYVDGNLDQTKTSSSKVCTVTKARIGSQPASFPLTQTMNGTIDNFRFSPCCRYPTGSTFTPPTSFTPDAEWFSLADFKWRFGSPVSWTVKQRNAVGECTTGASTVSNVVTYALRGLYDSGNTNVASANTYTFNHNIGTTPGMMNIQLLLRQTEHHSWMVVDTIEYGATANYRGMIVGITNRLIAKIANSADYISPLVSSFLGAFDSSAIANGQARVIVKRGW